MHWVENDFWNKWFSLYLCVRHKNINNCFIFYSYHVHKIVHRAWHYMYTNLPLLFLQICFFKHVTSYITSTHLIVTLHMTLAIVIFPLVNTNFFYKRKYIYLFILIYFYFMYFRKIFVLEIRRLFKRLCYGNYTH